MKMYKFLIPVSIAASALLGKPTKANVTNTNSPTVEQAGDPAAAVTRQTFVKNYVKANGELHALLLRHSGEGTLYAQHVSHSSHASHASHASHSSGQ